MSTNKIILLLLFIAGFKFGFAQPELPVCEKCKDKPVETIDKNLGAINTRMVAEFLCTFHESCITNLPYTEYSNRMLFWLLKRYPLFVINELEANPLFSGSYILTQIETPLNLDQDLSVIYKEVKKVVSSSEFKGKVLKSLKVAAEKTGVDVE